MNSSVDSDDKPLISIVIPVHNGAKWLAQTLESLYAQSYPHFEIVLVDDASSDGLESVLNESRDARLRVVHLKANVGVSAARNHGIDLAKGSYIAFCDADDLCLPQRLELQLSFLMQHPDISLCGSGFTCFDTQDRETIRNPETDDQIRKALMRGNCFGLSTVMARAAALKTHHFDPALQVAEDYDLWTRLASAGIRLANLPDNLVRYRLHLQQASRSKSAKLDLASRRIRGLYCASLLNDESLFRRLSAGSVGLNDLTQAARKVADFSRCNPQYTVQDFRFMLAWLYQLLPDHGLLSWWYWTRTQKELGLDLDRNYRTNIALLAILPKKLVHKYFDTSIKLKR